MAHVLAYTSPARGHLYPLAPVLDDLQRRGHQISVRTLASQVPLMRTAGSAHRRSATGSEHSSTGTGAAATPARRW